MNYVDRMVLKHEAKLGRKLRPFERAYLWELKTFGPREFFAAALPMASYGRYAFQISRRITYCFKKSKPVAYWTLHVFGVRILPNDLRV